MHQKFIITSGPGDTRGLLKMDIVISHRDLVRGYERVHGGGGWWLKDNLNKEIILCGESGDYGEPDIRFVRNRMGMMTATGSDVQNTSIPG